MHCPLRSISIKFILLFVLFKDNVKKLNLHTKDKLMLIRSILASLISLSVIAALVFSEADGGGMFSANQVLVSNYDLNSEDNIITFNADDMRLLSGDYELVLPEGIRVTSGDSVALSYDMDRTKISSLRAIHINGEPAWDSTMPGRPEVKILVSGS